MGTGNWILDNLYSALQFWNAKLAEIWMLITQSPQSFKGGGIWDVVTGINGALKAIGYALLVLFFLVGVVKTCGSFAEIKKPEHALKLFVRFAIAKGVISYGLDLMMALFKIVQGIVTTIIGSGGLDAAQAVTLPDGTAWSYDLPPVNVTKKYQEYTGQDVWAYMEVPALCAKTTFFWLRLDQQRPTCCRAGS